MDISVWDLIYKDPPITKADLRIAQQKLAPVNFPANLDKIELSNQAKALAEKLVEKVSKQETNENKE